MPHIFRNTPRRFFSVALFSAAVLASSSALAQTKTPEIYFYPSQGWSVNSGNMQCSVSGQFNNSFIMRFDGGERWVSGLEIDFRQDAFESGKDYDVTLSVPGVKSKNFKAQGRTNKVLAINLKKQKEFYQALRTSAVLDMSLEGNDFRFYLTGFAGSAKAFERCMAGIKTPKPDTMDTPVTQATAAPEPSTPQNFMVNEAIAMEAKEKGETAAVVEIAPEDPQPVVQEIPVKEVVKVGGIPVQENMPADVLSAPEAEEILEAEVLAPVAEAVSKAPAVPQNIGRKRLSEQLAEQIEKDPSLFAVDDAPPRARQPLKMPPQMDKLPVADEAAPEAEAAVVETSEAIEDTPAPAAPAPEIMEKEVIVFDDPPAKPAEAKVAAEENTAEPIEIISMKTEEPADIAETVMPDEQELEPPVEAKAEPSIAETILFDTPPQRSAPKPIIEDVEMDAPDQAELMPIEKAQAGDAIEVPPAPVAPPAEVVTRSTPDFAVNSETMTGRADFTNVEPEDTRALRMQVLKLEDMVEDLKSENQALNGELKSALKESEDERLSIASENWNLEQATMRFNEAERQIKRLGQQLQRERARHNQEKRELEAMLFDPQVTNQAQLARLAELEDELAKAQRELDNQRMRYEERLRAVEATQ
ncbi:MAG: hypothetical protein AAF204_00680 [Pseudomonadota bacterium]